MSGFEPLVKFNNNFDDSDLYYFDFNDNTWKGCEPISRIPYDLCKYRAINSEHEFIGVPKMMIKTFYEFIIRCLKMMLRNFANSQVMS